MFRSSGQFYSIILFNMILWFFALLCSGRPTILRLSLHKLLLKSPCLASIVSIFPFNIVMCCFSSSRLSFTSLYLLSQFIVLFGENFHHISWFFNSTHYFCCVGHKFYFSFSFLNHSGAVCCGSMFFSYSIVLCLIKIISLGFALFIHICLNSFTRLRSHIYFCCYCFSYSHPFMLKFFKFSFS